VRVRVNIASKRETRGGGTGGKLHNDPVIRKKRSAERSRKGAGSCLHRGQASLPLCDYLRCLPWESFRSLIVPVRIESTADPIHPGADR
jgi:hypothetical protein